ncbi:uncharacterized protein LOC114878998 isoform X2 [Osmia bicornis bicornis]|uniref:uncharacterized protein LOC114878998 isoform X2 n=1 Tax=Osmia bicornis bicornis TaxID=1437191 RepID=UPI0010F78758|nr:uncharacterized protein LOC114878998 isoform X2 [Osmia bicornis bicornis]
MTRLKDVTNVGRYKCVTLKRSACIDAHAFLRKRTTCTHTNTDCVEEKEVDDLNVCVLPVSQVLIVLLLSVIPWPGPSVFKISCPRDRASVVRRIVQKRWMPILKKYQVELPLECPFHESRDIFRPQQKAKHQHRPSQWTCGLCGKSFYAEKHLDAHFDNRHKSNVNTAEDAVCLADYCDIMRCDVLGNRDFESSLVDDEAAHHTTDIQVWKENTEQRSTSVMPCESRGLSRSTYPVEKSCTMSGGVAVTNIQRYCHREDSGALENHRLPGTAYHVEIAGPDNKSNACDNEEEEEDEEDDEDDEENLVEAALPAVDKKQRRKGLHLRKLKSNCKPEELQKLKLQCEILVRDCIAGLLTNLSVRDFQEIEGELNRAICWYLSCDRYWEDTKRQQRHTPWYLLTIFLVVLSSSIYACYYVIWVLFKYFSGGRQTRRDRKYGLHGWRLHGYITVTRSEWSRGE